ncbi:MAG: Gfo/Idh/MocA family oxidoreductase [Mucilaginibacter polytrichastri]|nr:Gfo/Idh/MocA family oxidoreductase [Mucilaginibacter polytrichastri]
MSNKSLSSRRKFLQQIGSTSLVMAAAPLSSLAAKEKAEERILRYERPFSPNDRVRLGVIGFGIIGHIDLETALKVPGVELAGICDLYEGRLQNAKELFGDKLFLTKDHHALLDRKDIDAVLIATPDHWHARIATEALLKGKAVYCEKPMVHKVEQGMGMIAAQKKSGKTFQVGSQRVSSLGYLKARELLQAGEIGKLNMVNAVYDRQSALGAWEYTLPLDAAPGTVDWARYTEGMGNMPFDRQKFFWWRNYRAFGTGVAGDLFVHLLSGTHMITGSKGPNTIFATGQLSYWKDGRDVPDVMSGIMQYGDTQEHPAFQLSLQVNFVSGTGGSELIRFIGSEGVIELYGNDLKVTHSIMSKAPGFGGYDAVFTYPKKMQEELQQEYDKKYSEADRKSVKKDDIVFRVPEDYDDRLDHMTNFFDSVRTGKAVTEDATFGLRAAAPALACNESYFQNKIMRWDPEKMVMR